MKSSLTYKKKFNKVQQKSIFDKKRSSIIRKKQVLSINKCFTNKRKKQASPIKREKVHI